MYPVLVTEVDAGTLKTNENQTGKDISTRHLSKENMKKPEHIKNIHNTGGVCMKGADLST